MAGKYWQASGGAGKYGIGDWLVDCMAWYVSGKPVAVRVSTVDSCHASVRRPKLFQKRLINIYG